MAAVAMASARASAAAASFAWMAKGNGAGDWEAGLADHPHHSSMAAMRRDSSHPSGPVHRREHAGGQSHRALRARAL